jgi:nuclear autoantigenic sperm protein
MKLKQAECLLKLGEIGLESEQYSQAVEDFKSCLELQTVAGVDAVDRRLAETQYQLGLAYSNNTMFDESVKSYRAATSIIEARIALLEKSKKDEQATTKTDGTESVVKEAGPVKESDEKMEEDSTTATKNGDKISEIEQELKELRDLLPEILIKIEDALEDKRNATHVKELIKDLGDAAGASGDALGSSSTSIGFSESTLKESEADSKVVTNVGHLVRRKRKPEEEAEQEDAKSEDVKKQKTITESGDATDNAPTDDAVISDSTTSALMETGVEGNGSTNGNGESNKVNNKANGESAIPEKNGTSADSKDSSDNTIEKVDDVPLPEVIVTKTVEDVKAGKEDKKMETA